MELSTHAITKLEIYSIDLDILNESLKKPLLELYDREEHSLIKIIKINEIQFACVFSVETKKMITIYRTDNITINNRRKSKRWT